MIVGLMMRAAIDLPLIWMSAMRELAVLVTIAQGWLQRGSNCTLNVGNCLLRSKTASKRMAW